MKILGPLSIGCALLGGVSCMTLNYPTAMEESDSGTSRASEPSGPPSPPVLLDLGFGEPEEDDGPPAESGLAWHELTKLAREAYARGDLDAARSRLEQAATRLENRPPTNAQRRAVFSMRARLARDLALIEREEESDALAEILFQEVSESPGLAGSTFAELAHLLADRRTAKAEEDGAPDPQLPLLRIALDAAQSESPTPLRMNRAFEISEIASAEGDHDLARRAIDRAVQDAQTVAPGNKDQLASLKIYKARIALAQGDLLTAEASAAAANRLFHEIDASAPNRAIAESTMARVVAETGDEERARAILAGAQARLEGTPPLPTYAKRIVLGTSARVERSFGDAEEAKAYYRRALEMPAIEFAADRRLLEDLEGELAALGSSDSMETGIETSSETEEANALSSDGGL